MKACTRCMKSWPHDQFAKNMATWGKVSSREHYERNKERIKRKAKQSTKRYSAHVRAVVVAAKQAPCTDCGVQYPHYVMEWDHLDGSHKRFNIGDIMHSGYSVATVKEELAKCELVCANCHRERTHRRKIEARQRSHPAPLVLDPLPRLAPVPADNDDRQLDLFGAP